MDNFKFVLNKKGVVELLNSQEMENILKKYSAKSLNKLGKGHAYNIIKSKDRKKAFISATTPKTKKENKKNNTLLKSLGG